MSRLILDKNESFTIGASSDVVAIFADAAGGDTVTVDTGANVILDPSFNSGKDTIVLQGNAASYTVKQSGSSVILTDSTGATTVIPVGTTGATLKFADASETLVYDMVTGHVQLGTLVVTTTDAAVIGGTSTVVTPGALFTLTTAIDTFTSAPNSHGNVFNGTDNNVTSSPTLTNFDTLTGNGLAANAGGDTLTLSYTNNPIDTTLLPAISVSGIATAFLSTTVQNQNGYTVIADTNTWSGLTSLNVAAAANDGSGVVVASALTTDVSVKAANGEVDVFGGNNVSVTTVSSEVHVGDQYVDSFHILDASDPVTAAGKISVTDSNVGTNSVTVEGGTDVTVKTTNGTGDNAINVGGSNDVGEGVAPTGAVVINTSQVSDGQGPINVTGGTTVNITEVGHGNNVSLGNVAVFGTNGTGGPATSSVTVTQTPESMTVTDGTVLIVDGNSESSSVGTITTVKLDGLGTSANQSASVNSLSQNIQQPLINFTQSATITDTGLTSLEIDHAASGVGVFLADGQVAGEAKALLLTLNSDVYLGVSDESGQYTSVTINAVGGDSTLSAFAPNVDHLTITGTANLTIANASVVDGVQIDATQMQGNVTIEVPLTANDGFNSVGSPGNDSITIDGATTQAIAFGSGMNTLTYNAGALDGGSLDGGSGTHNTLVMGAADAASLSAAAVAVNHFQTLDIGVTSGADPVVINLNNIGNINHVVSDGTIGNAQAPSAQIETFLAPALAAGQSVTIDGVTVTAIVAATADQVAHAIVSEQGVPNILVESGVYADTGFTVTQGTNIDNVIFTYNAGNGYQPPISVSAAGTSAVVAPTQVETTTPITAATASTDIQFNGPFAVGNTITVDGETVTVLSTTTAITAAALVAAFTTGNTFGGELATSGTLNTSEWTAAANGTLLHMTSVNGNYPSMVFTASNTSGYDPHGNVSTNGATPAVSLVNSVAGEFAIHEVETVTFSSLAIGQSITVDGKTITAIATLTAVQVAAIAGGASATHLAIVTGTADPDWSIAASPAGSNTVAYTYNVDTLGGHSVAIGASSGAVAAPGLAGTIGSPYPSDAAIADNLTYSAGNGSAPLVLNGYTSGGSLEFTSEAVIQAPVTIGLVGTAVGGNVFNVGLDGGVVGSAAVHLNNVTTLGVTVAGSGNNYFNLSETTLKTVTISDAPGTHGGVTLSDTTGLDTAGLTTIDAHLTTAHATDDVTGLTNILSETAALTFIGGADHLVAESANPTSNTTGLETITAGTGGVTFSANAEALGGSNNTQSYIFNLGATNHVSASNSLYFADGSALDSAPAVVNGFVTNNAAGHVDTLGFDGGVTILNDNTIVTNITGSSGLNETNLHGIITFGGIASTTASISTLLIAAETLVDDQGPGTTAAFIYHGDTYIVHAGGAANPQSDTVVELHGLVSAGLETAYNSANSHYVVI